MKVRRRRRHVEASKAAGKLRVVRRMGRTLTAKLPGVVQPSISIANFFRRKSPEIVGRGSAGRHVPRNANPVDAAPVTLRLAERAQRPELPLGTIGPLSIVTVAQRASISQTPADVFGGGGHSLMNPKYDSMTKL